MAEVVVFDIDAQSAIQKLVELRESTRLLKEQQKQLAEEVKKGNQNSAEAAKSYEANTIILKNLANEQRVLSRQVEGYSQVQKEATDTTNFANNSIQQNRDLLKQLTAAYIGMKNPPKEATEQIKRLSDTLKQQEGAIGDTRRNVGNYAEALGGLANRIPIVGKATDTLNKIQSASPVGRLVEVFFALVDALKGNAQVMDTITFLTAAINKAFQLLADRAVEVGKKIVEVFTNPKKILEDIGFVLTNPIEAFKRLSNAALQTGKDLLQAGKDGFNASKDLDAFTVAQAKATQATTQNRIEIDKLKKSLEDTTKTNKERIEIAKQITNLAIENSKIEANIAKQALQIEEQKLKGKQLNADEEAKLIELRTKLFEAENKFQIEQAEQQKKINELLQKEITDNLKKEVDARKFIIQQEIEGYDSFEKKIKSIEKTAKDTQTEIEKLLSTIYEPEEFFEEDQDVFDKILDNFTKFQLGVTDTITEGDIIAKLTGLDEKGVNDVIGSVQVITGAVQGLNDLISQSIANRQQELQDAFDSGKISEEEFNRQAKELALKEFRRQKAFNLVQATMDTVTGAISAYANTPGGPIVKGIAAAIATTFGLAQTAVIAAQQPPKFAEGGEIAIGGKSHAQGGEIVTVGGRAVAEVEGGEGLYVMKKNAYQQIKQFSAINEAFGGKSWLKGSSRYLADGGAINTALPILESRSRVNTQIEQNRLLQDAIRNIPAPVLSIKEFEKKQAVKDKSVRISEL